MSTPVTNHFGRKVVHVVGARPNFMKIAPVMAAIRADGRLQQCLIHTGQHHDEGMSTAQFRDLGLPPPNRSLNANGGPPAIQIERIQQQFADVLRQELPDLVVVVGDVNSTVAAARAAVDARIPVAHVEAGLRSFDRSMPEELNRIETDRLSSLLLTSTAEADVNLRREGLEAEKIRFVGNVMIDTLLAHRDSAPWVEVQRRYGLEHHRFAVLTLHRAANVDDGERLATILSRIEPLATDYPIVFPLHPRTAARLAEHQLHNRLRFAITTAPLGYRDFLALIDHAAFVLTDSGGIQEETTALGVPCFTIRDNTERPITVEHGTNTLVGADAAGLASAFRQFQRSGGKRGQLPDLWDGAAAPRIAGALVEFLCSA